jgi:predicted nucleotidyltransferase
MAELLAWLLIHPDQEFSLSELSRTLGVKLTTLHRDAGHLAQAGVLTERTLGRNRMMRPNPAHPAIQPLTRLMEITFGPRPVIAEAFAGVEADLVVIFGSWAARYAGQPGPTPHDIDVLVVGAPTRASVYDAADAAQAKIGLPVNPVIRSVAQWHGSDDKLVAQIRESPYLIVLGENEP